MSTTNDGGPAFPVPLAQTNDGDIRHASEYGNAGMTLLDYFATQAMAAFISSGAQAERHLIERDPTKWLAKTASASYAMAEAMLKERQS